MTTYNLLLFERVFVISTSFYLLIKCIYEFTLNIDKISDAGIFSLMYNLVHSCYKVNCSRAWVLNRYIHISMMMNNLETLRMTNPLCIFAYISQKSFFFKLHFLFFKYINIFYIATQPRQLLY